ncbi:uncharacterized protein LOC131692069 [Topomyia yanbarensis]|uniref:uncharacterized protein LOC131692069 n=1 Tax=Topomyia yanbarensis TaxID=2498891 RepID=UPI00273BA00F|nr:uncharacterized protein LOC131692069 [Topomyia yanbarensis]
MMNYDSDSSTKRQRLESPNRFQSSSSNFQVNPYSKVHARLGEFVDHFVGEFENKLRTYNMIVEGEVIKTGKFSDTFSERIGQEIGKAAGGLLGLLVGLPAAGAQLGVQVGRVGAKKLGSELGRKHHQEKVSNLLDLIELSQNNAAALRKQLVEAGYDIFQSFEMQFTRVTTELGAKPAVQLLAKDAVNRAIDCMANRRHSPISEGIILGRSKRVAVSSISSGFQIKYEHHTTKMVWNTAKLYEKVGLLVTQKDLYKKTTGGNTGKYGYRRLLMTENFDKLKVNYELDNAVDSKSAQFTDYNYILDRKDFSQVVENILEKINQKSVEKREQELKETIDEVKNDLLEGVNYLKNLNLGQREDRKILERIENSLNCLKMDKYLEKIQEQFKAAKLERHAMSQTLLEGFREASEVRENISKANNTEHTITQAGIATTNQGIEQLKKGQIKLDQVINELPEKFAGIVENKLVHKKRFIRFDAKKPVELFTGRAEELLDLHRRMNKSKRSVTVISQMTSICGLGGIGKTEFARKYIDEYSTHYDDNVVWINAESELSLIESFKNLSISSKNVSREEIVREVYQAYAEVKSLFIFDNADKSDSFAQFLTLRALRPQDKVPFILITSRNREWGRGVEVLELQELTQQDAVAFVKKGLKISDNDKSQDEELEKLVSILQCFPLAIQQAIAYIEDEGKTGEFSIRNYLEKYETKAMELLDCAGCDGIDNDYTKTTFTTWKITIDRVQCDEKYGEIASVILNVIAYFASDNIHRDMFLRLENVDEDRLKSAVRLLVKYSMINSEQKQSVLSIHRLVQEVTRLELKKQNKEEEMLRVALKLLMVRKEPTLNLLTETSTKHIALVWVHASKYSNLIKEFDKELTNTYGYSSASVIHMLAEIGSHEAIEEILKHTSNTENLINAEDNYKRTPLYIAAEHGYAKVVELLANLGAPVDLPSMSGRMFAGWTNLYYASKVANGVERHASEEDNIFHTLETRIATGWTPLHIACFNGHSEVVRLLISKNETLQSMEDNLGKTPFVLAVNAGHIQVAEFFNRKDDASLLQIAIQTENINMIESLVEKNVSLINLMIGTWTPLHLAAFGGKLRVAKNLVNKMKELKLDKNESIDHPGSNGCTPMIAASQNGHSDIIELFVVEGANLNAANDEGWTALHAAAQHGRLSVVKYLIEVHKFSIDVCDVKKDTPLHTAAFHGMFDVVEYLLKAGANFAAIDAWGATPMFAASLNNEQEIVNLLLQKGTKLIDPTDSKTLLGSLQLTVLHTAAMYDNYELMKDFIEGSQIDKDVGKDSSATPLHVAALFNSSKVITYLIEQGADVAAHAQISNVKTVLNKVQADVPSNGPFYEMIVRELFRVSRNVGDYFKITPGMIHKICGYPEVNSFCEPFSGEFLSLIESYVKHVRKNLYALIAYVERKKSKQV